MKNFLYFSCTLLLIPSSVQAFYSPNPHCSPAMMMAMMQALQPKRINIKDEQKELEERIEKKQEEYDKLAAEYKRELRKTLDNNGRIAERVLEQVLSFIHPDSEWTKDSFTEQLCGEDAELRCEGTNNDCNVWKRWMNCVDRHDSVDSRLCSNPGRCRYRRHLNDEGEHKCKNNKPDPDNTVVFKNGLCKNPQDEEIYEGPHTCTEKNPKPETGNPYKYSIDKLSPSRNRRGSGRRGLITRSSSGEDSVDDCEKWINDRKKDRDKMDKLEKELLHLNELLELSKDDPDTFAEQLTEAQPDCINCRVKAVKELFKPSPWQLIGRALSAAAGVGLGVYAIRDSNRIRDRQGFAAQPGLGLNLAYPFIMDGLYGGGLFGSLGCSPTMASHYGSVFNQWGNFGFPGFGNFGNFGFPSFGNFPGNMFGLQGNFPGMGNFGFPGLGNMFGLQGNLPGMGNFGFPGFGNMFGLQGNFPGMGNFGFPGMGNLGFPGMGNFGFQGGGFGQMQAMMDYQKAMMSFRQAQMNNWMQKQQSVQSLMSEMYRLQMQIQEIMYGGSGGFGSGFDSGFGGGGSEGGGSDGSGNERDSGSGDREFNMGRS